MKRAGPEAYTYSIFHIPSARIYYGCRKSRHPDLFLTYFTSSRLVKRLIREDGITAFTFRVRRWFPTYAAARSWETKLLSRLRAPRNPKMLNQAVSAPRICAKDSVAEERRRLNISAGMKTSIKRALAHPRRSLQKQLRLPFPPMGKQISTRPLIKGSAVKWIRLRAIPAYVKSGWKRAWYSVSDSNTAVPASPTSLAAL